MSAELRTVLVVEDDEAHRSAICRVLEREGYAVIQAESGEQALAAVGDKVPGVIVSDLRMPGIDGRELHRRVQSRRPDAVFVMVSGEGTVEEAVASLREGAYDYLTKPAGKNELIRTVTHAYDRHRLLRENVLLRERLEEHESRRHIIGTSRQMRSVLELVEQVAASSATVLIHGESGTGKELLANLLHSLSPRRDSPFVKLNCGALPDTLLEAELFGHERGAFTGAVGSRRGRFEIAHGGTLLLDEIADMPPSMQVKLLRVLQEGEFERVGGAKTLRTDVRIVGATHRDLSEEVAARRFREDLFFRLNVITVAVPPLRERPDDIPLLVNHFLSVYNRKNGKSIKGLTRAAMEALVRYHWAGNVRELENVIERAVVLCREEFIDANLLPAQVGEADGSTDVLHFPVGTELTVVEKEMILRTLNRTGGDKKKTARILGIAPRTIYRRLKELGIC